MKGNKVAPEQKTRKSVLNKKITFLSVTQEELKEANVGR